MKLEIALVILILSIGLNSCIKDEALNAEADINFCIIKEKDILKQQADTLKKIGTINGRISIMVKTDTDLTHLAPEFVLTPGATIEPASGTERDFTTPQSYTVTSQDGKWSKTYQLTFDITEMPTKYSFEHSGLDGGVEHNKYYSFYEIAKNEQKQYIWATGNPGYLLTGKMPDTKSPNGYPTTTNDFGVKGKCVKLETKDTGSFGALPSINMRIAAGNVFIGSFDVNNATSKPRESTLFGLAFQYKPVTLTGYYKYKAGKTLQDANANAVPGQKDACDIYGVFYETDDKLKSLNGADVLTSPNIVSMARLENAGEPDEWTRFELPFIMKKGKTIDKEKLNNNKYSIAIVFTSSIEGAYFQGAIGSTLYIDEVELVFDKN
ncbi:MAG: PCMD domain-containing protein [Bacteroidaceae bacterium]